MSCMFQRKTFIKFSFFFVFITLAILCTDFTDASTPDEKNLEESKAKKTFFEKYKRKAIVGGLVAAAAVALIILGSRYHESLFKIIKDKSESYKPVMELGEVPNAPNSLLEEVKGTNDTKLGKAPSAPNDLLKKESKGTSKPSVMFSAAKGFFGKKTYAAAATAGNTNGAKSYAASTNVAVSNAAPATNDNANVAIPMPSTSKTLSAPPSEVFFSETPSTSEASPPSVVASPITNPSTVTAVSSES